MVYKARDEKKLTNLTKTYEDKEDEGLLEKTSLKNEQLARLKAHFRKTPLYQYNPQDKDELFKTREHYQTHPTGLPIFLKSVRWERPILVNEAYKVLENWALMDPEDAIQLLDAKFPDERVRSYAV